MCSCLLYILRIYIWPVKNKNSVDKLSESYWIHLSIEKSSVLKAITNEVKSQWNIVSTINNFGICWLFLRIRIFIKIKIWFTCSFMHAIRNWSSSVSLWSKEYSVWSCLIDMHQWTRISKTKKPTVRTPSTSDLILIKAKIFITISFIRTSTHSCETNKFLDFLQNFYV